MCVSEVCTDPFHSVEVLPSVCLARVALEAAASLVCASRDVAHAVARGEAAMYKNREIFLPSVAQRDNELLLFAGI